jgi:uncharacterized protein YecE (DUF72 family)
VKEGRIFVGTSGWNYKHWADGVFYPEGLKSVEWLGHYYRFFDTVEINYSFYRLPKREMFDKWYSSTPDGFVFAVKANRFITHVKRLKEVETTLPRFLMNASGLKEKLGPILFQFPPSFREDRGRLEGLLEVLKSQDIVPSIRATFEFRHASWFSEPVLELLRESNAAVCCADWADLEREPGITADFVYVRRHGSQRPYTGSYSKTELRKDAQRVRAWSEEGKDVYIYFNNDACGWAVENALALQEMLKD